MRSVLGSIPAAAGRVAARWVAVRWLAVGLQWFRIAWRMFQGVILPERAVVL